MLDLILDSLGAGAAADEEATGFLGKVEVWKRSDLKHLTMKNSRETRNISHYEASSTYWDASSKLKIFQSPAYLTFQPVNLDVESNRFGKLQTRLL